MRLGDLSLDWFMVVRASLLSATIAIGLSAAAFAEDPLSQYNVVWTTPSQDSHGSMPLGNGDVGINAWVEPSGDLVFYVSKTDGHYAKNSVTHTATETNPWWEVDLGQTLDIEKIKVHNRTDGAGDRLKNFTLTVLDENRKVVFEKKNVKEAEIIEFSK